MKAKKVLIAIFLTSLFLEPKISLADGKLESEDLLDEWSNSDFFETDDNVKDDSIYQVNSSQSVEKIYEYSREDELDDSLITNTSYKFYADKDTKIELNKDNESKIFINGREVEEDKDINSYMQVGGNSLDLVSHDNSNVTVKVTTKDREAKAANSYMSNYGKDLIEDIIKNEQKYGFPAAQISVIKNGKEVYNKALGYINNYDKNGKILKNRREIDENTLFDLASNTKMYATNFSLQKLVYGRKIDINDKISKYFPEFKDYDNSKIKGKSDIRIKDLLYHQAGFPADPQYHNDKYDKDDGIANGKNDLFSQNRENTLKMILKTPLEYKPREKTLYSDVDYMLLGFIIEKVSGQRLDNYLNENFLRPLNLNNITFNPIENGFDKNNIAATELNGNTRDNIIEFKNIRKDTIQGYVHDEKAYYSMKGVSGHAGLFANARDLAKLASLMLNNGSIGNMKFWDMKTQQLFVKAKANNDTYGLGWRRMGENGGYSRAFSNLASKDAIGHTGWTGTLTIIDPIENMVVVLLTNKKNSPLIDNKKNPNDFYGDHFLTGAYGAISTLIYESFYNMTKDQVLLLSKKMSEDKLYFYENKDGYHNLADYNDYLALKETYENLLDKYSSTDKEDLNVKKVESIKEKELESGKIIDNKALKENPKTSVKPVTNIIIAILLLSLYLIGEKFYRKEKYGC